MQAPAGQHDAESDTTELLEYAVVENILDGRPMKGITLPELLEYSIRFLDSTLDGRFEREISDWEPEASPVPDANLDSRLMEGITKLEQSGSGGVPGQLTHGGDVVSGTIRAVHS